MMNIIQMLYDPRQKKLEPQSWLDFAAVRVERGGQIQVEYDSTNVKMSQVKTS